MFQSLIGIFLCFSNMFTLSKVFFLSSKSPVSGSQPRAVKVCALILVGRQRATRPMLRQLLDPSLESSARQRQKQQLQLRPAPAQGLQLAEVQLNPLVFSDRKRSNKPREKRKGWWQSLFGGSGVGMCSKKTRDVSDKIRKFNIFWWILVLQNVETFWKVRMLEGWMPHLKGWIFSKLKIPKWKCGLELHMRCGNVCPLAFSPIDLLKVYKRNAYSQPKEYVGKIFSGQIGFRTFLHLSGKTTSHEVDIIFLNFRLAKCYWQKYLRQWIARWWFQIFPIIYLGKSPILTNIFEMGWNHQLDSFCEHSFRVYSCRVWFRKGVRHCFFQF